ESRWFHALNKVSWTRSSARSRSPHSDTANARKLPIWATRSSLRPGDTLRGKLFLSALVEILQQSQKVVGDRLLGDLVERRADLTPDMGLQRRVHAFSRLGLCSVGAAGPFRAFTGVCRHAPWGLLLVVAVHSGCFALAAGKCSL